MVQGWHRDGLGCIPGLGVIWVEFVVPPRGFSLSTPVFLSPQNEHCQSAIQSSYYMACEQALYLVSGETYNSRLSSCSPFKPQINLV